MVGIVLRTGLMEIAEQLQKLTTLLELSLETLALGNHEIQVEALSTAKHIFELCMTTDSILQFDFFLTIS